MNTIDIRVPRDIYPYLVELCQKNSISEPKLKKDYLASQKLKSEVDPVALVSIVIGSAAFWTGLSIVLRELIKSKRIELTFKNEHFDVALNASEKNISEIINELKKLQEPSNDKNSK